MRIQNAAKYEKGYIEKTIGIVELPNGEYEIEVKATPTGKKKEENIKMTFTQNGLNALVGTWLIFCERKEEEKTC